MTARPFENRAARPDLGPFEVLRTFHAHRARCSTSRRRGLQRHRGTRGSIPLLTAAADATRFTDAGRRLSELHLGYEAVEPYPLNGLDKDAPAGDTAYGFVVVG